jgi:hypothetical protein
MTHECLYLRKCLLDWVEVRGIRWQVLNADSCWGSAFET